MYNDNAIRITSDGCVIKETFRANSSLVTPPRIPHTIKVYEKFYYYSSNGIAKPLIDENEKGAIKKGK